MILSEAMPIDHRIDRRRKIVFATPRGLVGAETGHVDDLLRGPQVQPVHHGHVDELVEALELLARAVLRLIGDHLLLGQKTAGGDEDDLPAPVDAFVDGHGSAGTIPSRGGESNYFFPEAARISPSRKIRSGSAPSAPISFAVAR